MFCVKCGEDVGTFRFCPHCGTAVPEKEAAVWSVGMACPNCGASQVEDGKCTFCGTQLAEGPSEEVTGEEPVPLEKLYGDYGDFGRGIRLTKNRIEICAGGFWSAKMHIVPYDTVQAVKFSRVDHTRGRVVLVWDAGEGQQTAEFGISTWRKLNWYCIIPYVIRCLVQHPIGVFFDVPAVDEKELSRKYGVIDWDDLFLRFGASRIRAVKQLIMEYAIPAKEGQKLVVPAFEARQIRCYEEDPRLAARDLVMIRFQ
ncbi:MAG: zinc ribbon domain-containing protein [Oscillospiraceae bacterium]|nr:zinc ribbon domain-containing protein [Oscillospiraceae bacterium]